MSCVSCGMALRCAAKFCDQCGTKQFASSDSRLDGMSRDVVIEGFRFRNGSRSQSAIIFCEDDWDEFRKQVQESLEAGRLVKEEAEETDQEESAEDVVEVENFTERVWALQDGMSPRFRDSFRLGDLIQALECDDVHPLTPEGRLSHPQSCSSQFPPRRTVPLLHVRSSPFVVHVPGRMFENTCLHCPLRSFFQRVCIQS